MRTGLLSVLLLAALLLFTVPAAWAGEAEVPFIGINPGEVTSDIASGYGVRAGEGVLIEGVVPGTPAEEAGFRANDVLTRLDDAVLTGPAELRVQLKKHQPGDTVNITYVRGGQTKTVALKLGHEPENKMMFGGRDVKRKLIMGGPPWDWKFEEGGRGGGKKKVAYAGIVTQSLSEGLALYFKVKKGALISEVVSDSPAEKAGLKAGDVIVKIGSEDIEDEDDVGEAIREHDPGDSVDFVIYREGRETTVKVTFGETTRLGSLGPDIMPDDPDKIVRVQVSPDEELERLSKELEQLQIEICVPQAPGAPNTSRAVKISRGSGTDANWQESFDRLRDRLNDTFDQLRQQMVALKMQLRDWAQRLHLATA
jgi:membrane-associated protease RseP (regulator of RpoE activity)